MARIDDPERLAALRQSGMLRHDVAKRLDHLVYSAAMLTQADGAQLNVVDDQCVHHVSEWPPAEPPTPPDHIHNAGCREVVLQEMTLDVPDVWQHPVMCQMPWTTSWRGYLGTPIYYRAKLIGSLCVLTRQPRKWSELDLRALEGVARLVGMSLD